MEEIFEEFSQMFTREFYAGGHQSFIVTLTFDPKIAVVKVSNYTYSSSKNILSCLVEERQTDVWHLIFNENFNCWVLTPIYTDTHKEVIYILKPFCCHKHKITIWIKYKQAKKTQNQLNFISFGRVNIIWPSKRESLGAWQAHKISGQKNPL